MRLMRVLIALACIVLGAIVGALNVQPVAVDFGVASTPTTLGVVMILALLSGVIIGGLAVIVSLVLPLRRRLARGGHPGTPLVVQEPEA